MRARVEEYLAAFSLDDALHAHAVAVLLALPEQVRLDLMGDPSFQMSDFDPAGGMHVRVASPRVGVPGRSVSLKRTLRQRPAGFIRYVIAHELAHAYLRNAGRHVAEDPELAADALAAEWGFPRVAWQ